MTGLLGPREQCGCAPIFQRNISIIVYLVFVAVLVFPFLIFVEKGRVFSMIVLAKERRYIHRNMLSSSYIMYLFQAWCQILSSGK